MVTPKQVVQKILKNDLKLREKRTRYKEEYDEEMEEVEENLSSYNKPFEDKVKKMVNIPLSGADIYEKSKWLQQRKKRK